MVNGIGRAEALQGKSRTGWCGQRDPKRENTDCWEARSGEVGRLRRKWGDTVRRVERP